jgi:DNA-directed RNA polymerase specialized sigma24 family protein
MFDKVGSISSFGTKVEMPPGKKYHALQQEDFDRLLHWLDPDGERAGIIYEKIRWRLITILAARGCRTPEDLADETIDRVARRVIEIRDTYTGDKANYFLGVMNNVHHEYLKRPEPPAAFLPNDTNEGKEQVHACLEKCLARLTEHSRQLIERYYAGEKRAKIDLRERIALELGISINTLRLRALRIREKLQTCIEQCLQTDTGA